MSLDNTIHLALLIFPKVFTETNINTWQTELDKLEYEENSSEANRDTVWSAIFRKMLGHLKEKDAGT